MTFAARHFVVNVYWSLDARASLGPEAFDVDRSVAGSGSNPVACTSVDPVAFGYLRSVSSFGADRVTFVEHHSVGCMAGRLEAFAAAGPVSYGGYHFVPIVVADLGGAGGMADLLTYVGDCSVEGTVPNLGACGVVWVLGACGVVWALGASVV